MKRDTIALINLKLTKFLKIFLKLKSTYLNDYIQPQHTATAATTTTTTTTTTSLQQRVFFCGGGGGVINNNHFFKREKKSFVSFIEKCV